MTSIFASHLRPGDLFVRYGHERSWLRLVISVTYDEFGLDEITMCQVTYIRNGRIKVWTYAHDELLVRLNDVH